MRDKSLEDVGLQTRAQTLCSLAPGSSLLIPSAHTTPQTRALVGYNDL